jgi:hypothetical protein
MQTKKPNPYQARPVKGQIAAGNAGWAFQFRFAVHAGWSRVPELWTLGAVAVRASLAIPVVALGVALLTGCHRPPQFTFSDQTSITFTNTNPAHRDGVVLGGTSRTRFIDTVQRPESSFDPKFLDLSVPMGLFRAADTRFEYHLGLLVYRAGSRAHIWQNEFTRQLGEELRTTNGSWKQMLGK